jgi:drug/metabolite transporter (DMT)-like permease
MKPQTERIGAVLLVLLGATCYGFLSPLIKLAFGMGYTDIQVSVSQITMGTLLLWLGVAVRPKLWSNPFREPWWQLSLVGIFGLVLTTLLLNKSLQLLDASLALIMLFQFTWITMVLDLLVNRRRPSKFQVIAAMVILSGTLCAVGLSKDTLESINPIGIALGFASACTYSLFLFFTGRIQTQLHPLMKSAVMVTAALPIVYILYPPVDVFSEGTGLLLLWGLILGTLGQMLPLLFFNIGIPRLGSTLSSILASMELPVGMIAAWLILGELISPVQWVGMLLILIGVVIAERKS